MPFQTKNDRISRPHFEALILGNLEPLKIKTSFWGFDPCLWYVSSPHCEDLILNKEPLFNASFWGVDLCLSQFPKIKASFWGLDRILTEWTFCPLGCHRTECSFWSLGELSPKRERSPRNAPKFALICSTPTDTRRAHQNATQRVLGGTRASLPTFCRLDTKEKVCQENIPSLYGEKMTVLGRYFRKN